MNKGYYIPSYAECEFILKATPDNWFVKHTYVIDGYTIIMYSYLLAWYDEFVHPIPNSDIRATELRGIVFILDSNGNVCNRFLQLNKFWNIGQVIETQLEVLNNYTISHIYEKLDGTMISFIRLPNGRILPKTKASFEHPFLISVNKIVDSDVSYTNLITDILDSDCVPFFEYMGIENRVVIDYVDNKLVLIAVRCNKTGVYKNLDDYNNYGVPIAKKIDIVVDNLSDFVSTMRGEVDIEGCVIHFNNDYMVKLKTDWYFNLHGILTGSIYREDMISGLYLNNQLDDVISKIPLDRTDKLEYIYDIKNIIDFYVQDVYLRVAELISTKYNGDMVEFCTLNNRNEVFTYAKVRINDADADIFPMIVKYLKKRLYFFKNAKMFMDEWRKKRAESLFI